MTPSNAVVIGVVTTVDTFEFSRRCLYHLALVVVPRCSQMSTMPDDSKQRMLIDECLQGVVVAGEQPDGITRWIAQQRRRTQVMTELVKIEGAPLASSNAGCGATVLELKIYSHRDECMVCQVFKDFGSSKNILEAASVARWLRQ
jgi:hypothetical protein